MARNRKGNAKAVSNSENKEPLLNIPESEQWRIIRESGILKQVPKEDSTSNNAQNRADEESEGLSPFAEEMFNAIMLIIPMSFMLLLMEILVHYQYGRKPNYRDIMMDRMLPGVPIISVFVFYTNRFKWDWRMQTWFFITSCLAGARLVWLINRGNWLVVMRQSPPMATAWIYTIVQLNLLPSVVSLIGIAAFSWWNGLKLVP